MNRLTKAAVIYAVIAVAAFGFDKIYALFGHGVRSAWMSAMFLAPLILGTLVFLTLRVIWPDLATRSGYRLFFNLYNSGVAVLTNAMLLQGILDIAGGTSSYTAWFFYTAYGLLGTGAALLIRVILAAGRIESHTHGGANHSSAL